MKHSRRGKINNNNRDSGNVILDEITDSLKDDAPFVTERQKFERMCLLSAAAMTHREAIDVNRVWCLCVVICTSNAKQVIHVKLASRPHLTTRVFTLSHTYTHASLIFVRTSIDLHSFFILWYSLTQTFTLTLTTISLILNLI